MAKDSSPTTHHQHKSRAQRSSSHAALEDDDADSRKVNDVPRTLEDLRQARLRHLAKSPEEQREDNERHRIRGLRRQNAQSEASVRPDHQRNKSSRSEKQHGDGRRKHKQGRDHRKLNRAEEDDDNFVYSAARRRQIHAQIAAQNSSQAGRAQEEAPKEHPQSSTEPRKGVHRHRPREQSIRAPAKYTKTHSQRSTQSKHGEANLPKAAEFSQVEQPSVKGRVETDPFSSGKMLWHANQPETRVSLRLLKSDKVFTRAFNMASRDKVAGSAWCSKKGCETWLPPSLFECPYKRGTDDYRKVDGRKRMHCPCGYEFCYYCGSSTNGLDGHLCEDKAARRNLEQDIQRRVREDDALFQDPARMARLYDRSVRSIQARRDRALRNNPSPDTIEFVQRQYEREMHNLQQARGMYDMWQRGQERALEEWARIGQRGQENQSRDAAPRDANPFNFMTA
ncbi:MAG: hypothetical protein Q9162_001796 [Coniocarpon cinnabarinum]